MVKQVLNLISKRAQSPDQVTKASAILEPNDHYRFFDVGVSNAQMIKIQKRHYNEHMYSDSFQDLFYDESALSRFEVIPYLIYKCNEDCPNQMLYNIKICLFNIKKVLILPQANFLLNSKMFTWLYLIMYVYHPLDQSKHSKWFCCSPKNTCITKIRKVRTFPKIKFVLCTTSECKNRFKTRLQD